MTSKVTLIGYFDMIDLNLREEEHCILSLLWVGPKTLKVVPEW